MRVRVYEGELLGEGLRVGVAVARFNEVITQRLLAGCLDALQRHGVAEEDTTMVRVPGAFELPLAAKLLAEGGNCDVVVCLGAVIRGATPHFEYVAAEVAKGVAQVGLSTGVPALFGVITADTLEQAIERAGSKGGNKGFQAAQDAIEMGNLLRRMRG
ncbi:MAG: 6,7-dimethyl-8-ribityllumazine synthase [Thermaerobacter sp.]|jgi:6,7-dimethyl-8-ribityllumazine synthase|nr:6,7-dimethyl-8-ribityllumazine synthase [Thermaerobacter sp.]